MAAPLVAVLALAIRRAAVMLDGLIDSLLRILPKLLHSAESDIHFCVMDPIPMVMVKAKKNWDTVVALLIPQS